MHSRRAAARLREDPRPLPTTLRTPKIVRWGAASLCTIGKEGAASDLPGAQIDRDTARWDGHGVWASPFRTHTDRVYPPDGCISAPIEIGRCFCYAPLTP